MKQTLLFIAISALIGCQREVEIENPYPVEVRYCDVPLTLQGRWFSDSVWIETAVDTLDSIVTNTRPTYVYLLTVECDEDTVFLLEYFNFSGVLTREVYSTHFLAKNDGYAIFSQLNESHDTALAEFRLTSQVTSDTTMTAVFTKPLGSGQVSTYTLFLHRRG